MAYTSSKKATELETLTDLESSDVIVVGDASDSGRAKAITRDNLAEELSPDASTTLPGKVEEATQAEVDAGTAAGSDARLFINPSTLRAKLHHDYVADSVGTDAYAITVSPAITAYTVGQRFIFKVATANTGACTLNVNSLGAKTIKKAVTTDLSTGDLVADQIVEVVYDGTNMQMVSKSAVETSFPTLEVTVGTTHALTTTANQRVVVWAKGDVTNAGDSVAFATTLKYNGVTKDTVNYQNSARPDVVNGFALMYTEVPGAATQNITVTSTASTLSNVVIMVMKIG